MLKSMSIVSSSSYQFFAVQQVIGYSHIKIIETRSLD